MTDTNNTIDLNSEEKERVCTDKEELFAQEFVRNGGPSAAYKIAYNAEKMGKPSISAEAYKLRTSPHVALRIKKIREDLDERYSVSKVVNALRLEKLVDANMPTGNILADEARDPGVVIKSIKELNKMYGHHAPTKSEVTGKDGGSLKIEETQKVIRVTAVKPDDRKSTD